MQMRTATNVGGSCTSRLVLRNMSCPSFASTSTCPQQQRQPRQTRQVRRAMRSVEPDSLLSVRRRLHISNRSCICAWTSWQRSPTLRLWWKELLLWMELKDCDLAGWIVKVGNLFVALSITWSKCVLLWRKYCSFTHTGRALVQQRYLEVRSTIVESVRRRLTLRIVRITRTLITSN